VRPGDLREIARPGFFDALAERTRGLVVGLLEAAQGAGVSMTADCEGGMFGFFFAEELPQNYTEVMATDRERFNRFFHAMLDRGVYLAPALYEAGFVSAAHSHDDVAATVPPPPRACAPDRRSPTRQAQAGDRAQAVDLAVGEQVLGAKHRLALLAGLRVARSRRWSGPA
jgi:hypothetical protein